MQVLPWISAAVLMLGVVAVAAEPPAVTWTSYRDPEHGYSVELPLGLFEAVEAEGSPGITLAEVGGAARLSFYGGPAEGMTRDGLEARLAAGEDVAVVTYRDGGDSWFVLSGYYQPDGEGSSTIFYTKVLFSADHGSFSAFEISFPEADKPRFEAVVERLEDNFTRPTR